MFKVNYFFQFTKYSGSMEVGAGYRVFRCNFWINPSKPLLEIIGCIEKEESVKIIVNVFNKL